AISEPVEPAMAHRWPVWRPDSPGAFQKRSETTEPGPKTPNSVPNSNPPMPPGICACAAGVCVVRIVTEPAGVGVFVGVFVGVREGVLEGVSEGVRLGVREGVFV